MAFTYMFFTIDWSLSGEQDHICLVFYCRQNSIDQVAMQTPIKVTRHRGYYVEMLGSWSWSTTNSQFRTYAVYGTRRNTVPGVLR